MPRPELNGKFDSDPNFVGGIVTDAGLAVAVAAPQALPAGSFDVIVANILARPLVELAPLFAARTRPDARLALSGILASQADEVIAAYAPAFALGVERAEEGWALVAGRRR